MFETLFSFYKSQFQLRKHGEMYTFVCDNYDLIDTVFKLVM